MTNLPPDNLTPLDYQKPPAQKPSTAALVTAILFAVAVSVPCFFAFGFFISAHYQIPATLLPVGILIFTAAAIAAKKINMSAALAITLAAICTLILMCSLCSAYPFVGP